ncbi:hypothetical protein EV121DRAFT_185633, partial [Schizophyllum commune]
MPVRTACVLQLAATRANLEYLRNGVAPILFEDIKAIKDDYASLELELQHVDDEISRLQVLREQLRTQLAISRTTVVPIRRLPPELLAQIFIEVANTSVDAYCTRTISSTVACACKTWRAVAHSVPNL